MTKAMEHEEWHVRRTRDGRTVLLWFIDANADRMTFPQFLDRLESSEAFRTLFFESVLGSEVRSFVWETPAITPAGELECALTEVPPSKKKVKSDPGKYDEHFRSDELFAVIPDGESTIVVPAPRQAEGWYADVGVFMQRIRPAQVHAVWQAYARAAKQALAKKKKVWLRSTPPGVAWLELRVDTNSDNYHYRRFAR